MAEEFLEVTLIGASWAKRREMYEWCHEVFGDRADCGSALPVIYFKHQEDLTMFMLRWNAQ